MKKAFFSVLVIFAISFTVAQFKVSYESTDSDQTRAVASDIQNADLALMDIFNYKLTDVTQNKMQLAFKSLNFEDNSTRRSSVCANRAHFWAYDLYRRYQIQSGKVFIFYTNR